MTPEDPSGGPRSHLLRQRIVLLASPLDDQAAQAVIAQLLLLESQDAAAPITLHVSSEGGAPAAALAIVDMLHALSAPVGTLGWGTVAGAAVLLLASGTQGKRRAMPSSTIRLAMLPPGARDPQALAELQRLEQVMGAALSRATGQTVETVLQDTRRGRIFTAQEARGYGLIDEVVPPK